MFFLQHLDNYIDALFFGWKIRSTEQLFLAFLRKVFWNLTYLNKNSKKGFIPYIYYIYYLLNIIRGQIVDRNIILTGKNCRFYYLSFDLQINKI